MKLKPHSYWLWGRKYLIYKPTVEFSRLEMRRLGGSATQYILVYHLEELVKIRQQIQKEGQVFVCQPKFRISKINQVV